MHFFTLPLQTVNAVANGTVTSATRTPLAPARLVATAVGLRGIARLGYPIPTDVSIRFSSSRENLAGIFPAFIRFNELPTAVPNEHTPSGPEKTLKELKV